MKSVQQPRIGRTRRIAGLATALAVALVISLVFEANSHVLELGASSIAALIATRFGEADTIERSGLVGAGLALFLLTFAVNLIARRIVASSKFG